MNCRLISFETSFRFYLCNMASSATRAVAIKRSASTSNSDQTSDHTTSEIDQTQKGPLIKLQKRDHVTIKYDPCNTSEPIPSTNESNKWAPTDWEVIYSNIRRMRSEKTAPVDTMGCDIDRGVGMDEKTRRYHVLISLMLSSQTKDEVNHAAMTRLIEHNLSAASVCEMTEQLIGELIYPVGFWKTKAKNIKLASQICIDKYSGDIPPDLDSLKALPGVGPKMAYLTMTCAWKKVVGIGVDVHVHRIANRLKWVRKPTKNPEATRIELESWLPKDKWSEVNHMLVGFGQTICLPVKPKCDSCMNNMICPAAYEK